MENKVLVAITSANNLELTIKCVKSIDRNKYDILIVDDASTEPVMDYCYENRIPFLCNNEPSGVTSLWNKAYQFFKDGSWTHLILSNNDVIYSSTSIENMLMDMIKKDFYLIGPLSNKPGANHAQSVGKYLMNVNLDSDKIEDIEYIQSQLSARNVDPMSIARINGFCFMLDRNITKFANTVDCLFPPHFINTGNEDWLCDEVNRLEPSRIGISFRSHVFHYKAKTTRWCKNGDRETFWRDPSNPRELNYDRWKESLHSRSTKFSKPTVLCTADRAMGLGDGVMMLSVIKDLSEKYNVKVICSEQSYNVVKLLNNGKDIQVFNMNQQGHFFSNDFYRCYNLIYWDTWNTLRQFPHQAINMMRLSAELPLYIKKDKRELYPIPIDPEIDKKIKTFIDSLKKPVIVTNPFMSYWNKMIDHSKYHQIVDGLDKMGSVIQIGGNLPREMISKKGINMVGNTSLEQSYAILKHADLLVSCDSFVQHAAASLKTPAVVMFCGTHPEEFGYPFHINIAHPEIAFCQTKCARPMRWLYDYEYQDNNSWNSRNESGWVCPSKLCERVITVDEVLEAAKRQIEIGKDRDWTFYDYIHG